MNELPCPSCSAPFDEFEMCRHDYDPICISCCSTGEHAWREPGYDPRKEAA